MALEATDGNFDELVLNSDKPVIVDFWAEWCGPCRMVGPIVEEVGVDYDGKAVVAKVDVDSNPGITAKYGIRNIPTILFFKNGEVADKQVGAVPKSTIVGKLEARPLRPAAPHPADPDPSPFFNGKDNASGSCRNMLFLIIFRNKEEGSIFIFKSGNLAKLWRLLACVLNS